MTLKIMPVATSLTHLPLQRNKHHARENRGGWKPKWKAKQGSNNIAGARSQMYHPPTHMVSMMCESQQRAAADKLFKHLISCPLQFLCFDCYCHGIDLHDETPRILKPSCDSQARANIFATALLQI